MEKTLLTKFVNPLLHPIIDRIEQVATRLSAEYKAPTYLVGSGLTIEGRKKPNRVPGAMKDLDLRVFMDDAVFTAMFGLPNMFYRPGNGASSPGCMAWRRKMQEQADTIARELKDVWDKPIDFKARPTFHRVDYVPQNFYIRETHLFPRLQVGVSSFPPIAVNHTCRPNCVFLDGNCPGQAPPP